jgi:hypothetical protein
MNSIRRILILTILVGSLSLEANKLAAKRAAVEARAVAQEPVAPTPVVEQLNNEQLLEQASLDQLLEMATQYEPNLAWAGQPFSTKKAMVEQFSPSTKEQVFGHMVHRMMDSQATYPFVVPQGTNYSQMDTFFLLVRSLMSHDRELCHKLTHCIGEKQVLKLGTKLNGCLDRVPQSIQNMLSPKKLNWQDKIRLANTINWRIKTKADPNAPQTGAPIGIQPQQQVHKHKRKKSFMDKVEKVLTHVGSAFTGGVLALYAFVHLGHKKFETK